jgi:hypothetical protein
MTAQEPTMNRDQSLAIERHGRPRLMRVWLALPALLAALWLPAAALAQLSSPVPPGASGPGQHSPNSPFAPLVARADVVPWSVLTDISFKADKTRMLPVFKMAQLALHQKTQRIQGFMMPLEPGERQRHFLLTSVPMTCGFCTPGGPESMVEVRSKTPVKYSMEPVTVEGQFVVLNDDPFGLLYRLTDALSVK